MLKVKEDKLKNLYDFKISKKRAIEFSKRHKGMKISIMSDSMMKAMFMNTKRLKYSAKLISYFIDIEYEKLLDNMELVKNELDKEKEESKGERADYVARIDDTTISIEVNNNDDEKYLERNMEYADRLYSEKVNKGSEYKYNQVIQINLNNFSFEGNDKVVDIYSIQNEEGIRLSNKKIFIQIYISNLRKKWYDEGVNKLTNAEKYILALVEEDIEKLEELGDEIVMNEYIEEAEDVSFESNIGESYDHEQANKELYEREGFKKGIEKGSLSKSKEIAKSFLQKGIDINVISECTGLSIEEINKL